MSETEKPGTRRLIVCASVLNRLARERTYENFRWLTGAVLSKDTFVGLKDGRLEIVGDSESGFFIQDAPNAAGEGQ